MQGWKTFIIGLAIAVVPGALQYLAVVDWSMLGVPLWLATMISGGVMMLMRFVTTSPIFKKNLAVLILVGVGAASLGGCAMLDDKLASPDAQRVCSVLAWGLPLAEARLDAMLPGDLTMLADVRRLVADCSNGTLTSADLASTVMNRLVAFLWR